MTETGAHRAAAYRVGIDGGGTGTRARLVDAGGRRLGEGRSGPSTLRLPPARVWSHLDEAIAGAFADAGLPPAAPASVALGLGLAGSTDAGLRDAFLAHDRRDWAARVLASDGEVALAGAHGDGPGVLVIAGTGSVGEARDDAGRRRSVGGWGFPVGDEGSGAWLGLAAMRVAQAARDGRGPHGPLAEAVVAAIAAATGMDVLDDAALLAWCLRAGAREYASLAPAVFAAAATDLAADALLAQAAAALDAHVHALDPGGRWPVAVSGSVGLRLKDRLAPAVRARLAEPRGDACDGALALLEGRA